jgi:hypothetical protein
VHKRLTSFLLFLALAVGTASGMPLHTGSIEMMDCCDKAMTASDSPDATMARVCCAVNCQNSAPTAPGISVDFSPSAIIVTDSVLRRLAALFRSIKPANRVPVFPLERAVRPPKSPPKYLQNHSFLI